MSRRFSLGLLYGSLALVVVTAIVSMIVTRNVMSASQPHTEASMTPVEKAEQGEEAWAQIAAQYFPPNGRPGGVCQASGGQQVACR